jgi:hypothetical protein
VTLSAPTPLADHHELAEFNSGVPELDDWLRRRARANQTSGASRTFVVCEGSRVITYCALACGAVKQPEACLAASPLTSPIRDAVSAKR